MADEPQPKPFWSSVPGMLTGLGGVIVAITGLITVLYSTGVIGAKATADANKLAPANTAAAIVATPQPKDPESDRYKALAGRWEVVEAPPRDLKKIVKATWDCDIGVSGSTVTLNGRLIALGGDKNLEPDEEGMRMTLVTTLNGSSGMGEYRVTNEDGTTIANDVTVKFSADQRQLQGTIAREGRIFSLTGRKL